MRRIGRSRLFFSFFFFFFFFFLFSVPISASGCGKYCCPGAHFRSGNPKRGNFLAEDDRAAPLHPPLGVGLCSSRTHGAPPLWAPPSRVSALAAPGDLLGCLPLTRTYTEACGGGGGAVGDSQRVYNRSTMGAPHLRRLFLTQPLSYLHVGWGGPRGMCVRHVVSGVVGWLVGECLVVGGGLLQSVPPEDEGRGSLGLGSQSKSGSTPGLGWGGSARHRQAVRGTGGGEFGGESRGE